MTPKEQRIAIAKACGYKHIQCNNPTSSYKIWTFNDEWIETGLPDYLNDLNAMHEAEKILTQEKRVDYTNNLAKVCGTEREKPFATAAQRAEAFLHTMGLWTPCIN